MQTRIDEVNRLLREQITGVRVVRAFVREPLETQRFAAANEDLTAVAVRAGRWLAAMFPVVMLVANVASVAVLWFGGHRVESGEMQVGALTAYLAYLMQIVMSVMMGTFMMMMIPRSAVCADRIVEVLDTDSTVVPSRDPVAVLSRHGALDFEDVEFSYPGAETPVLRGVTLAARPGQTVAVIGSTGAGKSTLVNLVPRLFDVTAGRVLVDGVDVRDLEPDVLWSRIGLVPQRAFLFSGTVASNLLHGKPDATDEEIWEALRVAQAEDFVRAMPEGLDGADHPGRHQRERRPAATPGHRPSRDPPARDLPLRRLLLRPRPGHRRPAAGGAAPDHARRDGRARRPAGVHDPRRRPDRRPRGRPGRRPRHPPRAARRPARPTRRSSRPS